LDHVFWSKKFKIGILTQDYFDLNLKKENILLLCKGTEFPEERPEWKSLIKNIQNKYYEKYKKIKIVVYQDRNLKEFTIQNSLKIIYESLKKNTNHEIIYVEFKNFKLIKCDFAIMWNVYCKFKQDTDYRKKIKNFQKINNNKLIIVELGFIDRKKYYSFGLDHISNFGNYPKFPNNDIRLKKFSYELKELNYNKNPEKHILFCSQVPWDTQVQDLDYSKWIINTLKEIKKYSKRKIIFRKHPKHSKRPGFEYFDKFFLNKNKIDKKFQKIN
jgi:hypothetical protein